MALELVSFIPNTKIKASEANSNFSQLETEVVSTSDTVSMLSTSVSTLNTNMALKADKNGSVSEVFSVADATETSHSVNLNVLKQYVPAGSVIWSARSSAPSGYLICNGAAVSRTTYASLFAAIGTAFGTGDGSTTFNLPLLTDNRFVRGSTTVGNAQNAYNDILPAHTHPYSNSYFNQLYQVETTAAAFVGYAGQNASASATTSAAGSGSETYPKNVSLLPCIKY